MVAFTAAQRKLKGLTMCGISGIVHFGNSKQPIAESLCRMADQMRNRGPDGEGFLLMHRTQEKPNSFFGDDSSPETKHTLTSKYSGKHIKEAFRLPAHAGFAHRRLSIIDLSHQGHQPMCTSDRRYWIIYNGEIYNYLDIKSRLTFLGCSFSGKSDTEVLLNAYVQWGPDCLQKLNGMFAFSIWDDVEKTLFCARDRIGIKPFYYTFQNSQFIFASDIKTLIESGLYKPEPNLEGVYHAMSFGVAPRSMTAFKDVFALQQGHWMRIEPYGEVTQKCYWSLPVGTQDLSMDQQSASNLLEEAIHKSVERRLVSDVPVGTFMSGGIDSTTISAIASQKHPGIKAFTLAFNNSSDLDELKQAKSTAALYPLEHIVDIVEPQISLDTISDMVRCYEEPFYSLSPNFVVSKLASKHSMKVVLSGLGGDELFAGYSYYKWARSWRLLNLFSPFLNFVSPIMGEKGSKLKEMFQVKSPDRLHSVLHSKFSEKEKNHLFENSFVQNFNSIEYLHNLYVGEKMRFTDPIEAFNYMDMMNYLGNHHLYRMDQFSMRFSIEARFPYLDHELVELSFRIPSCLKLNKNTNKFILREVAKKYVHSSNLNMRKKGFGLPVKNWMQGPLKNLVSETIKNLSNRDFINRKEVDKCTRQFFEGNSNYTKLWSLVSLELWFNEFFESAKH